ncbi:hypothetical protein QJS10_CPA01g01926 [Acorus calamus]|uniref:Secreted protein n=1 Tax=Acorus calamus TaxID=4465 RepID=A0AAV9FPU5_ACOCL|nr:hypothetical protein QJS10_CPA01g01926 [Acorus calamus]
MYLLNHLVGTATLAGIAAATLCFSRPPAQATISPCSTPSSSLSTQTRCTCPCSARLTRTPIKDFSMPWPIFRFVRLQVEDELNLLWTVDVGGELQGSKDSSKEDLFNLESHVLGR